jgi:hypothetical protein
MIIQLFMGVAQSIATLIFALNGHGHEKLI